LQKKKGDVATFGIPISKDFVTPNYTVTRITLFAFPGNNDAIPKYIKDQQLRKIGELIIELVGESADRGVMVKLFFASSSLELQCYDLHNSEKQLKMTFQMVDAE